ncbi:MAG: hypothetical protein IPP01_14490 [Saprospiraceae bacterium]|nr:hypothetical protein [Saprospiraceae bacterium]
MCREYFAILTKDVKFYENSLLVAYQFYADSLNTKLYSKIESFNFETGVSNWHHIDSCIGIGFRNIYADKDRIIVGGSSLILHYNQVSMAICLVYFNSIRLGNF